MQVNGSVFRSSSDTKPKWIHGFSSSLAASSLAASERADGGEAAVGGGGGGRGSEAEAIVVDNLFRRL